MANIEEIAKTALSGDPLLLRSLVQDFLKNDIQLSDVPRPATTDTALLAISASLIELFAERAGQSPPSWTLGISGLPEALFLLRSAATMRRLRLRCEKESPTPLKRRNLFATADYLTFA